MTPTVSRGFFKQLLEFRLLNLTLRCDVITKQKSTVSLPPDIFSHIFFAKMPCNRAFITDLYHARKTVKKAKAMLYDLFGAKGYSASQIYGINAELKARGDEKDGFQAPNQGQSWEMRLEDLGHGLLRCQGCHLHQHSPQGAQDPKLCPLHCSPQGLQEVAKAKAALVRIWLLVPPFDHTRPHTPLATRAHIEGQGISLVLHPPYSPDFSFCNFPLFPVVGNLLTESHFGDRIRPR